MKRIRIHGLAQVRAALGAACALDQPVALVSPVACPAGIGWWRELLRLAAAEFPDTAFTAVLDCGPSAGMALAAIRTNAGPVEVKVDAVVLEKLADIARQAGTQADPGGAAALDLTESADPAQACRDWLTA